MMETTDLTDVSQFLEERDLVLRKYLRFYLRDKSEPLQRNPCLSALAPRVFLPYNPSRATASPVLEAPPS